MTPAVLDQATQAGWKTSTACHDGVTRTPIIYRHDPRAGTVAAAYLSPRSGLWVLCEGNETLSKHDNFEDLNDAAELHFEALSALRAARKEGGVDAQQI